MDFLADFIESNSVHTQEPSRDSRPNELLDGFRHPLRIGTSPLGIGLVCLDLSSCFPDEFKRILDGAYDGQIYFKPHVPNDSRESAIRRRNRPSLYGSLEKRPEGKGQLRLIG